MAFYLKSFVVLKLCFKFSECEIQNFETASDGKPIKIKVVVLDDIYNFIVETFFIWIFLESQIFISKSRKVNTKGMDMPFRHTS
jgi:hypothetical protein